MKIFISHSGPRSRQIAEAFHTFLPTANPSFEPWYSYENLDRSRAWYGQIVEQLSEVGAAIICLTPDNLEKPWIHYEAGALIHALDGTRVYTYLYELGPADIGGPLALFNHTQATQKDTLALVSSLNELLEGEDRAEDERLQINFNALWESFQKQMKAPLPESPDDSSAKTHRADRDLIEEMLNIQRRQESQMSKIGSLLEGTRVIAGRIGAGSGHMAVEEDFSTGLRRFLKKSDQYDRIDVFAHTGDVYLQAIRNRWNELKQDRTRGVDVTSERQSSVLPLIKRLRVFVRDFRDLSAIHFPAKSEHKETIASQLSDACDGWQRLRDDGAIRELEIRTYPFEPMAHFLLADDRAAFFGLYGLSKAFPGPSGNTFPTFCIDDTSEASGKLLETLKDFFQKLVDETTELYAPPVGEETQND